MAPLSFRVPFEAAGKEDSSRVTESLALPVSSLDKDRNRLLAIVTPAEAKTTLWHQKWFSVF